MPEPLTPLPEGWFQFDDGIVMCQFCETGFDVPTEHQCHRMFDPDLITGTADDAIPRATVEAIKDALKQTAGPSLGNAKCVGCSWRGPVETTAEAGICPKCSGATELVLTEPARPEGLSIAEARSLLRQVADCISGVDQREGLQELRMRIEAALQKR